MAILKAVPVPHKCSLPPIDTDYWVGSVWQCDECLNLWVAVDISMSGRRNWQMSVPINQYEYGHIFDEEELANIVSNAIERYLEEQKELDTDWGTA